MNKLLTILFLIPICLGYAQEATINGIIHYANSPMVYLESIEIVKGVETIQKRDSSELKSDGSFNLEVEIKQMKFLILSDGSDMLRFVLMPGDQLTLETDKRFFDEALVLKGVGSDRNIAIHQLEMIKEGIHQKVVQSMYDPDTVQIFAEYDLEMKSYLEILDSYQKRFPELRGFQEEEVNRLKGEKDMRIDFIRSNHEMITRLVGLTNQPAPELIGVNLKGETVKLSDFKGKITILDFWATWCGPCRAEFPKLEEFQKLYGKEVHFVSVGTFCSQEEWMTIAKNSKIPNQIFIEESNQKQLNTYALTYIPRYIVLDAGHKIISANAPLPSSGVLQKYWVK